MSDDAVLIANYARTGDPQSFAALVQRHGHMVFGVARRITRSVHDAEDIAQECFIELARCASSISGNVAAWLHTTTVRRSLNNLRANKARRHRDAAATAPSERGDAEIDLPERVQEEMDRLPERQRAAIVLHVLEGRTQAEVAQELGLDQSTVSRAIDQGLETVRSRLRHRLAGSIGAIAALAAPDGAPSAEAVHDWSLIGISGNGSAVALAAKGVIIATRTGAKLPLLVGALVIAIPMAAYLLMRASGTGTVIGQLRSPAPAIVESVVPTPAPRQTAPPVPPVTPVTPVQPGAIVRVGNVRVYVKDLGVAHKFYIDQLGLKERWAFPGMFDCVVGNVDVLVLEPDGQSLPHDHAMEIVIGRFTGMTLMSTDIGITYKRLKEAGIRFDGPPALQQWGGTMAQMYDPDGNGLSLMQEDTALNEQGTK